MSPTNVEAQVDHKQRCYDLNGYCGVMFLRFVLFLLMLLFRTVFVVNDWIGFS